MKERCALALMISSQVKMSNDVGHYENWTKIRRKYNEKSMEA